MGTSGGMMGGAFRKIKDAAGRIAKRIHHKIGSAQTRKRQVVALALILLTVTFYQNCAQHSFNKSTGVSGQSISSSPTGPVDTTTTTLPGSTTTTLNGGPTTTTMPGGQSTTTTMPTTTTTQPGSGTTTTTFRNPTTTTTINSGTTPTTNPGPAPSNYSLKAICEQKDLAPNGLPYFRCGMGYLLNTTAANFNTTTNAPVDPNLTSAEAVWVTSQDTRVDLQVNPEPASYGVTLTYQCAVDGITIACAKGQRMNLPDTSVKVRTLTMKAFNGATQVASSSVKVLFAPSSVYEIPTWYWNNAPSLQWVSNSDVYIKDNAQYEATHGTKLNIWVGNNSKAHVDGGVGDYNSTTKYYLVGRQNSSINVGGNITGNIDYIFGPGAKAFVMGNIEGTIRAGTGSFSYLGGNWNANVIPNTHVRRPAGSFYVENNAIVILSGLLSFEKYYAEPGALVFVEGMNGLGPFYITGPNSNDYATMGSWLQFPANQKVDVSAPCAYSPTPNCSGGTKYYPQ